MPDLDWDLLDRYFAGVCTPAEQERFERWLAEAPNRHRMEALRRALAAIDAGSAPRLDAAGLLGSIKREIAAERAVAPAGRATPVFRIPARRHWSAVAKVAAAVLIVVGGALVARAWHRQVGTTPRADTVMRAVITPRGQRATFRLPDGTRVMLGVASRLERPADFGTRSRDIYLTGEAYFEVTRDEQRPFVVHAGDIVARDLGTEFVVRAYPDDPHARVVVREGKVAVSSKAASDPTTASVIAPGQVGRLGADGVSIVQPADTTAAFAWMEGTLVLHDIPLRDALPQLGRWYDLEFRLADPALGSIPLSGSFKDQLTKDELSALAASVGLEQVSRGRVVTLYRKAGGS
jgi:transmembrane sensor